MAKSDHCLWVSTSKKLFELTLWFCYVSFFANRGAKKIIYNIFQKSNSNHCFYHTQNSFPFRVSHPHQSTDDTIITISPALLLASLYHHTTTRCSSTLSINWLQSTLNLSLIPFPHNSATLQLFNFASLPLPSPLLLCLPPSLFLSSRDDSRRNSKRWKITTVAHHCFHRAGKQPGRERCCGLDGCR